MSPSLGSHLDAVQILVAVFFLFFAGLVYVLRQEDKREGYPMVDISPRGVTLEGFPPMPAPKTYNLLEGGTEQTPHYYAASAMRGVPAFGFPGAPLEPVGDPMLAELGPGAYPMRSDLPMMSDGELQTLPLRHAHGWRVSSEDPDPRGMPVMDVRYVTVGRVVELWVDRSVKILRYLEVELSLPEALGERVLLPIYYADVRGGRDKMVRVRAIRAHQFANVPRLASPDQITAREEDRVSAYYASGFIFSFAPTGAVP